MVRSASLRVSNHEAEHAAILRDARKGRAPQDEDWLSAKSTDRQLRIGALGRFRNYRNFACRLTQISNIRWPSRPDRGALRNVINAGRDAVDAGSALDETCCSGRRSRVVLTPRCWRQVCDKKRRRRCQTSLVTGESTKETVKPLRGECRVISGVTVVTTLVCSLHLSHARLRVHRAPGIPCAL